VDLSWGEGQFYRNNLLTRKQQLDRMRAVATAESTVAQADALSRALAAAKAAAAKVRTGFRR
jgi:uncharacterized membrane protein